MTHPVWHGVTVCECIALSGPNVEARFVAAGLIQRDFAGLVSQGCYSAGAVEASKGTHDGGGVLDIADWTPYKPDADTLFTGEGWIAFFRWPNQLYPGSPPHWHVVLYGCPHLSPQAISQVTAAVAGLDGLKGKGKDTGPRPYRTWQEAMNLPKPTITEQDDDMYVQSVVGGGLRLVTDKGSADLGTPGNADQVLSALNARATRTYDNGVWTIHHSPTPCLPGEADTLNGFLSLIAGTQVVHVDAATIAADLIASGLASAVVDELKARL